MEGITHLLNGFVTFFSVKYLLACFTGIFMGTIVGVLPGVGPTATMTLMLPFTFAFGPSVGLITLTGVLCGAMYGGSTTSILVNMPGEAASVVTCIDGYQMAKKGRGGAALALVAFGSFVAGTLGIVGLQIFAPFLGKVALSFGSPEYFSFMILAFVLISNLAGGSPLKSFIMLALGLWLSSIGVSPLDNVARFTFGVNELMLGIEFVPLAVGLFGLTEIISLGIEKYVRPVVRGIRLRELYPNREEIRRSIGPMFRGSILGFFIGLLPGPSAVISSFVSYSLEKKVAKDPDRVRPGRGRGGRRPGIGQQQRGDRHPDPPFDPGDPLRPLIRRPVGRAPHAQRGARTDALPERAGDLLDLDRRPVHRERDAPGAQPALRGLSGQGSPRSGLRS